MLMVWINFLLPLAPRPLRGGSGLGGWVRACGSRWAETQPQGAGMRVLGSLWVLVSGWGGKACADLNEWFITWRVEETAQRGSRKT